MSYVSPSDEDLKKLLTGAKTIAMVGASGDPEKTSHGIMQRLQRVGFRVIPVNPRETEILGERAYPSLSGSEDTPAIADEAVKVGAKALWLQSGISNEDAAARARAGGLTVVMNACIAATHSALQVPKKSPS